MTDDQSADLIVAIAGVQATLQEVREALYQVRDLLVVMVYPPEPAPGCPHPAETRTVLDARSGREEWVCNAKDDNGRRCGYHFRTVSQLTPT